MPGTFSEHLRQRAGADPAGVAVIDEHGDMTNADLDALADAVAHEVRAAGAQNVAVIASNSARFLAHAFGVWRAGATLVTVYPSSPAAEIAYALEHSGVQLTFADEELAERIPEGTQTRSLTRHVVPTGPFAGPEPDGGAAALVCYTSGSTQRPKAVVHSHASVLAGAAAYGDVWRLGPGDTTLVVLPMAWAFGLVTTSMAALLSGGRVRSVRRSKPEAVLEAISADRVTFVAGVTTIFAKLVDLIETRGGLDEHRIRLCISGGEPRNEGVFDRWRALTGVPVHDVYAASECFPVVTYDPVIDPVPVEGCAGRVVPGADLQLRDPDTGQRIESPGIGEAYARGPALFTEYQGDPETTARVLTDGWYRTGDLVEVRADGLIRVLGRLSGMIIRGGANVAPAEIERVVRQEPDVADAVALGLPDERFGQRIVVVVTGADGVHPDAEAVLARCRDELAGYKVPEEVVVVDSFPVNERTGKIDRRRVEEQLAVRS
ncbi:class I adenylate-forming enzyme family protein [Microbacterium sp.]|nr:class I adenylate-forming enzyme family protein [Microbacterium sp.]